MTTDSDDFAARLAELDDLDQLPADLAADAEHNAHCAERLQTARRIRAIAPQLADALPDGPSNEEMTARVTANQRRVTRHKPLLLVAAATIAVGAFAVVVASLGGGRSEPDPIAAIADDLQDSDGFRFVLEIEATTDLTDLVNDIDDEPTELAPISALPTCDGQPSATEAATAGTLDLQPIVDALTSGDPCDALALVDAEVGATALAQLRLLGDGIDRSTRLLEAIDHIEPTSNLEALSIDAYRQSLLSQRTETSDARNAISDRVVDLGQTLQPLAQGRQLNQREISSVQAQLAALTAALDEHAPTGPPDTQVDWTQLGTGTWTPNRIEYEGVVQHDDIEIAFDNPGNDPLGLAQLLLDKPATLLDILHSAPTATDQPTELNWQLPDGTFDNSSAWHAGVKLNGTSLDQLTLRSGGTAVVLTMGR